MNEQTKIEESFEQTKIEESFALHNFIIEENYESKICKGHIHTREIGVRCPSCNESVITLILHGNPFICNNCGLKMVAYGNSLQCCKVKEQGK